VKKIVVTSLLFCSVILSSCAITQPEKEGESSGAGASIIFSESKITAPGFYPDVPGIYIPVLDELYLYLKLIEQYRGVEGAVERIREAIQERGVLPYPGNGNGATGSVCVR